MSDDEFDKIATPRGEGRSMTALQPRDNAPTAAPGEGSDWFGPRSPMHPVAPPQVAGRTWDFIPGFNLATQPRAYAPVTFQALRMLAEAFDPVRLIIERRKDQMARQAWTIRLRHEGGKRPTSAQLSPQARGLIKDTTQFFKHPTENLNFRSWMRMLVEDVLVLDAPALYCERDPSGNLLGLTPTDGSTVKIAIDDKGRIPRPFRWDGQPFMWNGATVNTSNYAELGFKIVDGLLYPVAYQQVLKGLPAVNLTTWDLIYRPMNLRTHGVYGNSCVEQIITTISIAMRRSLAQLEYFREGNQPDAIYGLPETWSPDNVQRFQDYFDSIYSGNAANRRKMRFIPSGTGSRYTALKEPPLKNEFDEYLIRIACFCFSYPPAAFVSLSNRSIAEQHEKQAEEEGVEPLKAWFLDLANDIIEREFSDEIEFAWTEEQEVDPVKQKEVLTGYAESGVLTLNQVREKIGEEPDLDPAANKLMVRTKSGYRPIGDPQQGD
jgi:hypothetical protein